MRINIRSLNLLCIYFHTLVYLRVKPEKTLLPAYFLPPSSKSLAPGPQLCSTCYGDDTLTSRTPALQTTTKQMVPKTNKAAGRKIVKVILPPLSADRFYAGVKKRPGPKRSSVADAPRVPPKPVESRYCSYTVSYKLRVLSYWYIPSIPIGPSAKRKPTRREVAHRFKIPPSNLTRWQKEEEGGKFQTQASSQKRAIGGGRARKWVDLERELYKKFLEHRGMGKVVRRGWF